MSGANASPAGRSHRLIISLLVLLAVILFPHPVVHAETQQAGINARGIVESAEISGIGEDEISPDIRDEIRKTSGQPFDQQKADELVGRIQAEKPGYTATARLLPGSESDRVRVIFFVERNDGAPNGDANVNSRYTVERVEIQGYDESRLSQATRDEINSFVGEKLDDRRADQIQQKIEGELRPRRFVTRRLTKGSDRQHIVVVFDVRNVRWIPFVEQPPNQVIYNSKQNFSAAVSANIFDNTHNRFYFGLANEQDPLLERFAGFNFGYESTKVGTERLGLALRYARYHERWQPSTVLADRDAIYRERNTFDPTVTFAFDPRLRVTAGVSLAELQIQYPDIHRSNANAAVGALIFRNEWNKSAEEQHAMRATYEVHAGNHTLDSDFIYTRHLVRAQYAYNRDRNRLLLRFSAGAISGNAPLFERFSLGDSTTLRGWNKFDIAPAGGNRMVYGSVQYGVAGPRSMSWEFGEDDLGRKRRGYGFGLHVFYDVGAVGNHGSAIQTRHSAGFGIGSSGAGFFMELGFPIRSERVQPIFMTGFRF